MSSLPPPAHTDRSFPLARFLIAGASLIMLTATALLVGFLSQRAERDLVQRSERYARLLIDKVNYELHNELLLPMRNLGLAIDLTDPDQREAFDQTVRKAIYGLDIRSLKLWSADGRLIYATDEEPLGLAPEAERGKIGRALSGDVEYYLDLDEDTEEQGQARRAVVEIFLPVHELDRHRGNTLELVPSDRVLGVVEVYFEVEDLVRQIREARLLISGVLVSIMLLALLLLYLVIRRGERLLEAKRQQRRALEARLNEAERVASLSMLTAGIAHEIRTPLGVVSSLAQTLEEDEVAGEKRRTLLAALLEETERMNDLVVRFLEFARPSDPQPVPCDLADRVRARVSAVERRARDRAVALELDLEPGLPPVLCEPDLLHRVLDNLLGNAIDACPAEGGRVRIEARRAADPAGRRGVRLAISDNGPGVPAEQRARIFEPFRSTKEGGVGLGLAIVAKLTEAVGGTATLRSPADGGPMAGATFEVWLVAAPPPPPAR